MQKAIGVLAFLCVLHAGALGASAQKDTPETPRTLPVEEAEVQGTCLTPRQAWLQHLYWAGGKKDYRQAALCFDTSKLQDPGKAPLLAKRLLQHLDSEGRHVDTMDLAATDPNYLDENTKRHEYRTAAASGFVIVKQDDGRWLLSAESLARIPALGLGARLATHLPPVFRTEFLGVKLWSYLGILLLALIAVIVQRITVLIIAVYGRRLTEKTNFDYLKALVERAGRPIGGLSMALVFYVGFPLLLFPVGVSQVLLIATKALAAFSMVWLGYRLIDVLGDWLSAKAANTDTKLDDQLVPLITKTLKIFVSILGGIFVLQNLNVDVGSLLAGVGLGGLAFALAAKDTVANLFGSVMIFIDKPFQIGDWIVVDNAEGTVEEVGFRTTRIRTFYNSRITVPNALITNTKVDNYGERAYRRYIANLGLAYDTPPAKVQAFCEGVRAIIAAMPGMRKDYYLVEFKEYGASALTIMVYCFMIAPSWNEELRTRTNLNLEILRFAHELGVSFAFPTQTLHIESLVQPGQSKPSHSGPTDDASIAGIVETFGPGGKESNPSGYTLTGGYDCRSDWSTGESDMRDG